MKVSVSFLKSNFSFEKTLDLLEQSSADLIHIDIADGLFVNNRTHFTQAQLEYLKKSKKTKEVHLMTLHIKNYIDCFSFIHPECFILSYEASANIEELISYVKNKGFHVGISINPFTEVSSILPYINRLDQIVVMSVIPGYGGQKFLPVAINKIKQLQEIKKEYNADFKISVDGGITDETLRKIDAKLDIAVSGSFICQSPDFNRQIKKLKEKELSSK